MRRNGSIAAELSFAVALVLLPGCATSPTEPVGEWRSEDPLSDLTPDDLELRVGCAVFLRKDSMGTYSGGTIGRGCTSGMRGAAYATSEMVVGPGRIESWDRGFSETGEQVWGAEKGAYLFIREEPR